MPGSNVDSPIVVVIVVEPFPFFFRLLVGKRDFMLKGCNAASLLLLHSCFCSQGLRLTDFHLDPGRIYVKDFRLPGRSFGNIEAPPRWRHPQREALTLELSKGRWPRV